MPAIEIAVPRAAQTQVQRAIGRRIEVRIVSPVAVESARLFVSTLSAIPAPSALRQVLERGLSIVIITSANWSAIESPRPLQRLVQLGRVARAAVEPFLAPDADSLKRILLAKAHNAEDKLIAAASIDDGEIVVWSCEPRELRCRVSDVPALRDLPKARLKKFSLSSSGSRLRWADEDIDFDLEMFRELSDPKVLEANQERFRREAKRFADAIRTLRKSKGLKQDQIGGLSERQVRRLESGEVYPHSSTLNKLAAAHELPPAEYVRRLSELVSDAA